MMIKNESDDSYAEEDIKPYNVKVIECAGPFFSFGRCPEPRRVYTLFDAIYTQLVPIPVARKKKSIKCVDECDKPDVVYLIDVYQGLLKSIIDEHLAKWFLRLYLEFLKKKLKRREIQNELFFNTHRMFDCDEFKLRQDDFVDILTNTTCKRKLLFEFLRLLGREVKKSLHKCPRIEISADMGKDSSWCLTGCGTDKKKKHVFTNYELYLRVIEFFVKRLKKCVITRARSTLCNTTLSCTYILALPLSETLTVGGIPILITLYVSAGVAVADPECNTGFVQTGLNPPEDGALEVAEADDVEEEEPETEPVAENGAEEEAAASTKAIKNGNGSNGSKAKTVNGNGKNGNGNGKSTNGKNGNKIEDVENSEDESVEKNDSEIESPEIAHDENSEDEPVENKPAKRNGKNGNGDKPKSINGKNGKGKNGKNKDEVEDIGKIEDDQGENKATGSNGKNGNGKNGKNGGGKVKDEKKPSKDDEELIPENHGEPEKH